MPKGAFLIRERIGISLEYVLTVNNEQRVNHYKIKQRNDKKFYISHKEAFRSLNELIYHYAERADGLCWRLTVPASRIASSNNNGNQHIDNDREISANELESMEELGQGHFGKVYRGEWRGIVSVAIKKLKPNKMELDDFNK